MPNKKNMDVNSEINEAYGLLHINADLLFIAPLVWS